jgi:hypothetical protein
VSVIRVENPEAMQSFAIILGKSWQNERSEEIPMIFDTGLCGYE